jgi:hypothetical protein
MKLAQIQFGTQNTRTKTGAKRIFNTGQIPSQALRPHVTRPFANVLGDLPVN